jgi:Protein of unknown function (DUF3047)
LTRARSVSLLAGLLGLAGCASTPDDGLLASTPIVREMWRESGSVVEVARFSRMKEGDPLPAGWEPWGMQSGKRPTEYRLVDSTHGTVLEATAERAATGLYRKIRISPYRQPFVEWDWRVDQLIPGADKRQAGREDSPARLVISFHGDPQKLDFEQRAKLRLAKALAGEALPYAMLIYVWANDVAAETVLPNPHIDRVQMIVVERGEAQLGQWVHYRRNILKDYRRAFDEEPEDIVAVGVLTDGDNTQQTAHALYGDITFRAR